MGDNNANDMTASTTMGTPVATDPSVMGGAPTMTPNPTPVVEDMPGSAVTGATAPTPMPTAPAMGVDTAPTMGTTAPAAVDPSAMPGSALPTTPMAETPVVSTETPGDASGTGGL